MDAQAEKTFARVGDEAKEAFERIETFLVEAGCVPATRSGYVSFTLGSEMVAAAHPRGRAVDVALALPQDPSDPLLFDAIDYKWRSLPVGLTVVDSAGVETALPYLRLAVDRVRRGETITLSGPTYAWAAGAYDPAFKKKLLRQRRAEEAAEEARKAAGSGS